MTQESRENLCAEKNIGELLHCYIMASRIDQNNRNNFQKINKEKNGDSLFISKKIKYKLVFIFNKFICELQNLHVDQIKLLIDLPLKQKQEDILINVKNQSEKSYNKLLSKYELENIWGKLAEIAESEYSISITSFIYTFVKNTFSNIYDINELIKIIDKKKYFRQKLYQYLRDPYNDKIIDATYLLFDTFLRCLCDVICRFNAFNSVKSLREDLLFSILNGYYMHQDLLDELINYE